MPFLRTNSNEYQYQVLTTASFHKKELLLFGW